MLLVHFLLAPSKGVQKFKRSDCPSTGLEVVEDALNTIGYGFEVVDVGGHLVNSSSERTDYKESLHERVKIASCAFIHEPIVSALNCFAPSLGLRSSQRKIILCCLTIYSIVSLYENFWP